MDWTPSNFTIQVVTGLLGAHAALAAVRDLYLGLVRTSLIGLIAGALSGWLLQTQVITMVNGGGSFAIPRLPEVMMIEALTGAVVGGIAALFIGFAVNLQDYRVK